MIVTITPDKFVNKGNNRPAFNQQLRCEALAALEAIDYVSINEWPDAVNTIKKLKPNFYCKGSDYENPNQDLTGKIIAEKKALYSVGGILKITQDQMFSSSTLINRYINVQQEEQREFIKKILQVSNFEKIKKNVEKFCSLKVLVIGEVIIDKYIFCEVLGKSGKESVLNFRKIKTEKYLGGSLAIARHLSSFCKDIKLLSFVGQKKEELKFIKSKIEKNIKLELIQKKNSQTIVKTRFIDSIDNRKLIGVYTVDDQSISLKEEKIFEQKILKNLKSCDLAIISDYGHGIFTEKITKLLSKQNIFKSLNAQLNSTNLGLHAIRKYKKIDNLIINASELRHEMRDREGNLDIIGQKLKKYMFAKNLTITRGRAGALLINKNKRIVNCPAFNMSALDKIGAGDAMFAILSLCIFSKLDDRQSLLLASIAAAQSVSIMGNSYPIKKNLLLKNLFHLLK